MFKRRLTKIALPGLVALGLLGGAAPHAFAINGSWRGWNQTSCGYNSTTHALFSTVGGGSASVVFSITSVSGNYTSERDVSFGGSSSYDLTYSTGAGEYVTRVDFYSTTSLSSYSSHC